MLEGEIILRGVPVSRAEVEISEKRDENGNDDDAVLMTETRGNLECNVDEFEKHVIKLV